MSTALAKADQRVANFRQLFDKQKEQVALALPKFMDADRMIRIALTAMQKTPKLLDCEPMSMIGCVMGAAELGLELSGPLGQCYVVPYYNKKMGCLIAQLQVGYRGMQQLAYRSGEVVSFPARVVYEKDEFDVSLGTNAHIRHKPYLVDDPGEAVAFYAVLNLRHGEPDFEVMSRRQLERHRDRYAKSKDIWDAHFEEMGKKTLIRRLAKRSPVSTDMVKAAVLDEYGEQGVSQDLPGLRGVEGTAEMTRLRMDILKDRLTGPDPEEEQEEAQAPGLDDQDLLATEQQQQTIRSMIDTLKWSEEQAQGFCEQYDPLPSRSRASADLAIAELEEIIAGAKEKPRKGR